VAGLLFMVYPYFTPNVASLVGVGIGLGAALYLLINAGW
jgi:hypothetical protein